MNTKRTRAKTRCAALDAVIAATRAPGAPAFRCPHLPPCIDFPSPGLNPHTKSTRLHTR